jgi:hypothetical protein
VSISLSRCAARLIRFGGSSEERNPIAPPSGYEVVPTAEGKALVDYLLSLKKNYPLPEAPEATE